MFPGVQTWDVYVVTKCCCGFWVHLTRGTHIVIHSMAGDLHHEHSSALNCPRFSSVIEAAPCRNSIFRIYLANTLLSIKSYLCSFIIPRTTTRSYQHSVKWSLPSAITPHRQTFPPFTSTVSSP